MDGIAEGAKVVLAAVSVGGVLISVGIAIGQLRSIARILKDVVVEQGLQGNRITAIEVGLKAHLRESRRSRYYDAGDSA